MRFGFGKSIGNGFYVGTSFNTSEKDIGNSYTGFGYIFSSLFRYFNMKGQSKVKIIFKIAFSPVVIFLILFFTLCAILMVIAQLVMGLFWVGFVILIIRILCLLFLGI